MEDNLSTAAGWGVGGMVQAVIPAMGKQQMKLRLLARCSPPAVQPGSQQALTDTGPRPGVGGPLPYNTAFARSHSGGGVAQKQVHKLGGKEAGEQYISREV